MSLESKELVQKISKVIYEKKGLNILALYVGHISSVTDYLIIAEGNVNRHVQAIGQEVVKVLRDDDDVRPLHVEGLQTGEWLLIDYSDVLVHIFMPGLRSKYQLESLWKMGKIVDLELAEIA